MLLVGEELKCVFWVLCSYCDRENQHPSAISSSAVGQKGTSRTEPLFLNCRGNIISNNITNDVAFFTCDKLAEKAFGINVPYS